MYDVVKKAEEQIGYTERSDGWTKFGQWYAEKIAGNNAFAYAPWCAMMITWCANEAGILDGVIFPDTSPQGSSCPSMLKWFEEHGCRYPASEMPLIGDLVFYSWDDADNPDHVGIVKSVEGVTPDEAVMNVVEGNINNTVSYRRIAYRDTRVLATVRPKYKEGYSEALSVLAKMCIEGFFSGGNDRERMLYEAIQGRVNEIVYSSR